MAAGAIGGGLGVVVLGLAVPLPNSAAAPQLPELSFDLAAATLVQSRPDPARQPQERLARPRHDPAVLTGPALTPPRKTWGKPASGPILQIGALGTKDKRIPDLAHIAFDWNF